MEPHSKKKKKQSEPININKATQYVKTGMGKNETRHMGKNETKSLTPYTKISLKWIKDQNGDLKSSTI